MSGVAGYAKVKEDGGKHEIYIQMKPDESLVIETFQGKANGEFYPYYEENGDPVGVMGDWTLTFVKGGPELPASKTVRQLESWTTYVLNTKCFLALQNM